MLSCPCSESKSLFQETLQMHSCWRSCLAVSLWKLMLFDLFFFLNFLRAACVAIFQILYRHEDQTVMKFLDKSKTSVTLPLTKDYGYTLLEIRTWGEGGDGPSHEVIVSQDPGKMWQPEWHLSLLRSKMRLLEEAEEVTMNTHSSFSALNCFPRFSPFFHPSIF